MRSVGEARNDASVRTAALRSISSAPDQTNNFLALAFGILSVGLIVFDR
jgi:hypothetical protein